jgi:inosine-uridine nucleoside N-ribohydrolase
MVSAVDDLIGLSEKFGGAGTEMYDPLAVGAVIDPTIVKTQAMYGNIETLGETVANRRNQVERNVLHDDRYIVEALDDVEPNAQVSTRVVAERFIRILIPRLQSK